MIFLDTSAIYALADVGDLNHKTSVAYLQRIIAEREELLTHNYVLIESTALLQSRLGFAAAAKFIKDLSAIQVEWIDVNLHTAAVREWQDSGKRRKSLVDHVSFLVMRRRRISTAFAFDADFRAAGFGLFENRDKP